MQAASRESARVFRVVTEDGLSRLFVEYNIASIRRIQPAGHLGKKKEAIHRASPQALIG